MFLLLGITALFEAAARMLHVVTSHGYSTLGMNRWLFYKVPVATAARTMMVDSKQPILEKGDFFADVTFSDLTIESADLSNREFERCTFRRCTLPHSRWVETRLEDCVFEKCDLLQMVPEKLALRGVTFADTRLMGVDWSQLRTMPVVQFERCDLRYSSFVALKLRKTRFVGCNAREAIFIDVDLSEADFTDTDMPGSTMQGCVLVKTDFSLSTGLLFNPQANQVKGARISVETAVALAQSLGMVVEGS